MGSGRSHETTRRTPRDWRQGRRKCMERAGYPATLLSEDVGGSVHRDSIESRSEERLCSIRFVFEYHSGWSEATRAAHAAKLPAQPKTRSRDLLEIQEDAYDRLELRK